MAAGDHLSPHQFDSGSAMGKRIAMSHSTPTSQMDDDDITVHTLAIHGMGVSTTTPRRYLHTLSHQNGPEYSHTHGGEFPDNGRGSVLPTLPSVDLPNPRRSRSAVVSHSHGDTTHEHDDAYGKHTHGGMAAGGAE